MIGHDDESEEVHFKVADRRKFNADGSLRDGVTLDSPKAEVRTSDAPSTAASAPAPSVPTTEEFHIEEIPEEDGAYINESDGESIPGAQDPASFVNFLSMLATNAATALGAVPNPATGQRHMDLETAKYWIDVLAMIREKTKANLHPKEAQLLDGLLGDMRMQYVQLVRATEEKLKAKAAQNLTGADMLGKK